ncbi:uncharacterized protein BP01DRAFT_353715 [Aspergillus saccharolyticus JOP 1030-1]|uniref:Uncharacterized protein n=1 Tax=Aspergillus saccharolyticus JOP 1030-1 TaxID=1450539 RepID=A0A318ZWT1_9EURO|nr:hypothetical protein BP01DRAFT_353715 [Aspergillus saccharolyticus JOP 1030-1]PYH48560.1 hypothetical protein BP01DRAFT_353715 [Aspergillus saccharolyticus JOP 1030-1]
MPREPIEMPWEVPTEEQSSDCDTIEVDSDTSSELLFTDLLFPRRRSGIRGITILLYSQQNHFDRYPQPPLRSELAQSQYYEATEEHWICELWQTPVISFVPAVYAEAVIDNLAQDLATRGEPQRYWIEELMHISVFWYGGGKNRPQRPPTPHGGNIWSSTGLDDPYSLILYWCNQAAREDRSGLTPAVKTQLARVHATLDALEAYPHRRSVGIDPCMEYTFTGDGPLPDWLHSTYASLAPEGPGGMV